MTRVTDIDMECRAKKFETALNRFMNKHQGHEEWREIYEWMYETGCDFYCDNMYANGEKNNDWCYALHLDCNENYFYFALIERA